ISDERNEAEARIITAAQYSMRSDPGNNQVWIELFNGSIHTKPHEVEQYQQVAFSAYHLPIPLDQTQYAPLDVRPSLSSVLERLDRSNWQDTAALRRLMEHYKDLAFPAAALILGMLGVPVGIVSKRSGRVGGFAVGVMIVIVYYVLNVVCEFFVTTRVLPPLPAPGCRMRCFWPSRLCCSTGSADGNDGMNGLRPSCGVQPHCRYEGLANMGRSNAGPRE